MMGIYLRLALLSKFTQTQKIVRLFASRTYKDSLNLPKTAFPLSMKDGLAVKREVQIQQACNFDGLYDWQFEQPREKTFILHDGPPYANGSPHIGHALNKILKDVVNRYKLLRGYKVHYVAGWDCHGMPIEHKVLGNANKRKLSVTEIRQEAKQIAQSAIIEQMAAFRRWGIMTNWKSSYFTYSKDFQVDELDAFFELYEKGLIYRSYMPVYWSTSIRTALAEAELEYQDNHVSRSVYVTFPISHVPAQLSQLLPVQSIGKTFLVVWTTTAWTLPANKAIAFNNSIRYCLANRHSTNELYVLSVSAVESLEKLLTEKLTVIKTIDGVDLHNMKYSHPLYPGAEFPLVAGDHVTADKGTGLVHTAPAHGPEDFQLALKYNLPVDCLVDESGCYSADVPDPLVGKYVLTGGNDTVISLMGQYIIHNAPMQHSYPYDWRTKEPVILRASKQWFMDISKIKGAALEALQSVHLQPYSRCLHQQLESRPYWCISRQRVWGLPLPVVYHQGTPIINRSLVDHVKQLILTQGSDCWWTLSDDEIFPPHIRKECGIPVTDPVQRGQDILDIWFDSGCTWKHVLQGYGGQADVYLEGLDQYGAWFQTSLLTSAALQNKAPYKNLVVHGFTVDEEGKKMSKSLGNVINPDDIINGVKGDMQRPSYGVDVLRWWAVQAGLHHTVHVGPTTLNSAQDGVWQMRKSVRYLMGNLADFEPPHDLVPYSQLLPQDRYMLHLLHGLLHQVTKAYEDWNFSKVVQIVEKFNGTQISKFYAHVTKDRMYCSAHEDPIRRSCQTVQYWLLDVITKCLAPVLPHICEEVFQFHPMHHCGVNSVFKTQWPQLPDEWNNPEIMQAMGVVLCVRDTLSRNIGVEDPVDFDVIVYAKSHVFQCLKTFQMENTSSFSPLCEILQASTSSLISHPLLVLPDDSQLLQGTCTIWKPDGSKEPSKFTIIVMPAEHFMCPRCRRFTAKKVNEPCGRCIEAMSAGWVR